MKNLLQIAFHQFLETHHLKNQSLLLGLSGGPDSLALFDLMLEYAMRNENSFQFAVAHVDHSWRPESSNEALILKNLVESHQIPFYSLTLDRKLFIDNPQNIEEACRLHRLNFFRSICTEKNYFGVVLGHHKDDQSETVLKRILEGSSLLNFVGIKPITNFEGLTIIRPLLNHDKNEIITYLQFQKRPYFTDPTNSDPRYLRSRMRETILPTLSSQFGKEVSSNLYSLSRDIQELQEFLEQTLGDCSDKIVTNSQESYLDLSEGNAASDFELKYLLRKFCDTVNMPISRPQLQTMISLIRNRLSGKKSSTARKV